MLLDTSRETLYNTAMSNRSHCNWHPTLWLYYTDGLTVPRHAQHCNGQWLILDSYCTSFKLLCHVVRMSVLMSNSHIANDTWPETHYCGTLCYRVVTSLLLWESFTVEVVLKVISVGTPAIRQTYTCQKKNLEEFFTMEGTLVACNDVDGLFKTLTL